MDIVSCKKIGRGMLVNLIVSAQKQNSSTFNTIVYVSLMIY